MMCRSRLLGWMTFALLNSNAYAAGPDPVTPSAGLLQIATALMLVVALVLAAAWVMRRLGPLNAGNKIHLKIIGGISVGNREKIMVVEVADQWLILGVTANSINNLGSLPKQEEFVDSLALGPSDPFSTWLRRTLDKRSKERPDNS